ncbi:MAG: GNAT family N-acetyltransferase [Cryomorphaceae bacterium]|jgi:GNAT superfamily N-acetyltransferase|nr:GNAT family N-acetyltransferase [Cryomorphaceae bacterium]
MIRAAEPKDVAAIFGLIKALATYERAPEQVSNTAQQLHIDLFEDRICHAIVAENAHGTVIGFALYYISYSTWKGRCLYLEDFYVQEAERKKGYGQALFDEVVSIAKSKGVKRMDWQVLDWNHTALNFYRRNHATLDPEWINGRLFFE